VPKTWILTAAASGPFPGGETPIQAPPCYIKSPWNSQGNPSSSLISQSLSTSSYLSILHITASDLAGVRHGVVNGDHPRVPGVAEEVHLVSYFITEEGIEEG
jgi:hypothetical protein